MIQTTLVAACVVMALALAGCSGGRGGGSEPLVATTRPPAAFGADLSSGKEAYSRGDYETAFRVFQTLAKQRDANAKVYLGAMFAEGKGTDKDHRQAAESFYRAAEWYHEDEMRKHQAAQPNWGDMCNAEAMAVVQYLKASEQGDTEAQYRLGDIYAKGGASEDIVCGRVDKDHRRAAELFRKAAEKEHLEAQFRLGLAHADGRGVEKNDDIAVDWFEKAADGKHAEAMYRMGFMHAEGRGVCEDRGVCKQDHQKAVEWYHMAADEGHKEAMYRMGLAHAKGKGAEKNDDIAVDWFEKAADKGFLPAKNTLGLMYAEGRGVEKNDDIAMDWFEKAAGKGFLLAKNNLGFMRAEGRGGPKQDDRKAVELYREAAEAGLWQAQYNLGFMYEKGRGFDTEDPRQAMFWYLKAAKQGAPQAQLEVGLAYIGDEDVPLKEAAKWFHLAAVQGNEDAWHMLGVVLEAMYHSKIYLDPNDPEATYWEADYWLGLVKKNNPDSLPGWSPSRRVPLNRFMDRLALKEYMEDIHEAEPATKVGTSTSPSYSGSGFQVSHDGEFVTNAHVVIGCDKVSVIQGGRSYDAVVSALDAASDLALLKVDRTLLKHSFHTSNPAKFSVDPGGEPRRASLGEAVMTAGYPRGDLLGFDLNVTSGIVSKLYGPDSASKWLDRFQITAPVQNGNSGGPVLDRAGNVIGAVVSGYDALQNVNFAIKGVLVQKFLKDHDVSIDPQPSKNPYSSKELAKRARDFTVLVHSFGEPGRCAFF